MGNENGNIVFRQISDSDKNQGNGVKRDVNKGKPANRRAESKKTPETESEADFKLEFTSNNMINGIILAELLGKPKILQKRRW